MPLPDQDILIAFTPAPRVPPEVVVSLAQRPPHVPDPPGPTGIRRDNPRDQGEIGLGDAIGWFSRRGLTVSIPLADNQPYDLIADIDGDLARVQVKTATRRSPYGRFVVSIETAGGNQSFHTRKPFDPAASDVLYVLTDAGDRFVIPSGTVTARHALTLGERQAAYRVSGPAEVAS